MTRTANSDFLVSLAAGIFIGGALFDALPEASNYLGISSALLWFGGGFVIWWLAKIGLPTGQAGLRRLRQPAIPFLTAAALWLHSILEGVVTGVAFGVSQTFGLLIIGAMTLHLIPEFLAAVTLMKGAGSTRKRSVTAAVISFILLYASLAITYQWIPELGLVLPAAIAVSGGAFLFVGLASFWKRRSRRNAVSLVVGIGIVFLQGKF